MSEEQEAQGQEAQKEKKAEKVERTPEAEKQKEAIVVSEPAKAELAVSEPAKIEPAKVELAASEPAKAEEVKPVEEKAVEEVRVEEIEEKEIPGEKPSLIFAVKTTANQERAVANLLEKRAKREKFDIRAILVPDELKGYILVETTMPEFIEQAIATITHARSVVKGSSSFADVEHFLTPKPAVTGISEGSIIELIAGPFKGEKARVRRVDEAKEEITVELFEAMVPIPVTVRGDHVRMLSKEETEHSLEKKEGGKGKRSR